jgi:two-component system sensor histidine kinase KdpD
MNQIKKRSSRPSQLAVKQAAEQKTRKKSSILYSEQSHSPKKQRFRVEKQEPLRPKPAGFKMQPASRQRLEQVFLSALAHDLRSPVTAISGAAEQLTQLARTATKQPGLLQLATIIFESARKLDRTIGDLLDTRLLASKDIPIHLEWHDIIDIIADLKQTSLAPADKLRVDFRVIPEFPLLYIDHRLFTRALANLIDNALKNSPADTSVVVHAGVKRTTAVITITDEGAGFTKEQLRRPASRDVTTRSAAYTGMGIGMWISREFILAHGGTIKAANRHNRPGAIVTVRLPFLPERQQNISGEMGST